MLSTYFTVCHKYTVSLSLPVPTYQGVCKCIKLNKYTCRVLDDNLRSDIETQRLNLAKEKEDLEREQEAFEKRRQTLEEAQLRLEAERRDMELEHAAQVLPPFLNSSSLQNEVFTDPPIGKGLAESVGAAEEERRRAGSEGE